MDTVRLGRLSYPTALALFAAAITVEKFWTLSQAIDIFLQRTDQTYWTSFVLLTTGYWIAISLVFDAARFTWRIIDTQVLGATYE